jgi:hypothetical protein
MFADKVGAYPSKAHFRILALSTNIRLGWRGLPGTNTLAYYDNPQITAVKSFTVDAPDFSPKDKPLSNKRKRKKKLL